VQFVHSNTVVHNAVVLYCFAIKFLLNHKDLPNKRQEAFRVTYDLAKATCSKEKDIMDWFNRAKKIADKDGEVVIKDQRNPAFLQGWLRNAFTLAFAFL